MILRSTSGSVALVAVASLVSACSTSGTQDSSTLTVAIYGGTWGAAIQESIIEPFEEEYDVTVRTEPGTSAVTLSKLQQQQNGPQIDVAFIDGGISEEAEAADLVAPIDVDAFEHAGELAEQSVVENDEGEVFAITAGYYALGLVYNTDKIKNAPTSWTDLWDAQYAGRVAMIGPSNSLGIPLLQAINDLEGGSSDDVDLAIEKISEMDLAAIYNSGGDLEGLLANNTADIGPGYASSAYALQDSGAPVEYVAPEEGAIGQSMRMHAVEGAPHPGLAQDFIDFAMRPESQKALAETLYVAPGITGVELAPEAAKRMPWGESGEVADLILPDWNGVNGRRDDWIKEFNQMVVG